MFCFNAGLSVLCGIAAGALLWTDSCVRRVDLDWYRLCPSQLRKGLGCHSTISLASSAKVTAVTSKFDCCSRLAAPCLLATADKGFANVISGLYQVASWFVWVDALGAQFKHEHALR